MQLSRNILLTVICSDNDSCPDNIVVYILLKIAMYFDICRDDLSDVSSLNCGAEQTDSKGHSCCQV